MTGVEVIFDCLGRIDESLREDDFTYEQLKELEKAFENARKETRKVIERAERAIRQADQFLSDREIP